MLCSNQKAARVSLLLETMTFGETLHKELTIHYWFVLMY